MLKASIVIPTHNRAEVLPICLQAIAELDAAPDSFEIIVVDNNSKDNTKDVVLALREMHPTLQIRYFMEENQGVSYARNRGVKEANGDITCLLDDDSPPFDSQWLYQLLKPFSDPLVGCVGGPSIPDFQGQKVPPWLRGDLQGLLSGYGLPYTSLTEVSRWEEYPLSCNMAIRRKLFNNLGYFRTDLDRSGNQVLAAGDTEMADRIHKAGWKVMYTPYAYVRHLVPPERLTKAHIYRIGRGLAESHIILTSDHRIIKIFRWFTSDIWYATRMFIILVYVLLRGKPLWFDDYMRFWMVAMRLPLRIKSLMKPITA